MNISKPEPLPPRVDALFAQWAKPDSPGAAVAVVKGGEIAYKGGYGMANLEYGIPIEPATVFHVASISKQFTAFCVALLAHEGRISLDDDIRQYLPEVPYFGPTITIRHLIHHTSGLRDQWELLILGGWRMDDVITRDQIMKMVRRQSELNFEPGAEHLYCNTGYTLLAEVVEVVSGQSFPGFAQERIFKPLAMNNTHFHHDHEMIVKNRAYSYGPDKGVLKKKVLSYSTVGASSLFTTVEDLSRWVANFDSKRVGGPEVLALMGQGFTLTDGTVLDYTFGLKAGQYRGLETISHSGADAGFRSHLVMFPEEDLAVIVLSNLSTCKPAALAISVADLYLADSPGLADSDQAPASPVAGDDPEPPLRAGDILGTYLLMDMIGVTIAKNSEDEIVMKAPLIGQRQLTAPRDGSYRISGLDQELILHHNEEGKVTVSLSLNGYEVQGEKVETCQVSPETLAALEGDYYSPELDTTYRLRRRDGQIVVEHRKIPDIPLIPIADDDFATSDFTLGRFRFEWEEDGGVTGFRLTRGRVRNLRFYRVKTGPASE